MTEKAQTDHPPRDRTGQHDGHADPGDLVQSVCTCAMLRRTARAVSRRYDAALRGLGLTLNQFSIMATIDRLEQPTVGILAQAAGMDRTTLTRNLRPIEKAGWLRIAGGEDRRLRNISLTRAGTAVLADARACWRDTERKIRAEIGRKEAAELRRLLDHTFQRMQ